MKKHFLSGAVALILLLSACAAPAPEPNTTASTAAYAPPTVIVTQAPTVTEPIPDAGLSGVALTAPEALTVTPDAPVAAFTVTAGGVCPDGEPEGGRLCLVTLRKDGEVIRTVKDFLLTEGASLDFSVELPFARYASAEDCELTVELNYGKESRTVTVPVHAQDYPDEYYAMNSRDPYPYAIKVYTDHNVVIVCGRDEDGDRTRPVKVFLCSTGYSTPKSGKYSLLRKYEWRALIHGLWGQYATWVTGNILFHSVPYTAKRKNALQADEYNLLGTSASAGCIRLCVSDCKWLFDNCPCGTPVTFYTGKALPKGIEVPEYAKTDTGSSNAGWDPTDPDPDNPWKPEQPDDSWKAAVPDYDEIITANTTLDKAGYEQYIKTAERFTEPQEESEEP